ALDVARERTPHEHVALGRDREAVGAALVLAGRQVRREALGDADLRRVLDLEDRVGAHAGDVERVVRLVPRARARLMLPDRRGGLVRAVLAEAEERELVRDRRLEAAAVAALVATGRDLDRRLALERHDRLMLAHERHRERATREAVTIGAAMTA